MHSELAEVFSGMGKIYGNVSQSNVLDINFAHFQDFFFCDPKLSNSRTPRSKDFFFTSCGSLIPFTRANAQWVIHGFN